MDIIFGHAMRYGCSGISKLRTYTQVPKARTERNDNVPANNFFDESLDVRERVTVRKIRKTIRANNSVNLCLCPLLDPGEERQSQEERVDGRNSLATREMNTTYHEMFKSHTVSAPPAYSFSRLSSNEGIQTYRNTKKRKTI